MTNFRPILQGVIRNVARRFASRPVPAPDPLPEIAKDDATQSRLFDRTWAQAIMAQAGRLQRGGDDRDITIPGRRLGELGGL